MEKIFTKINNKICLKKKESISLISITGVKQVDFTLTDIGFTICRHLLTGGTTKTLSTPLTNYMTAETKNTYVVNINKLISNDGYRETEIIFDNLNEHEIKLSYNKTKK